MRMPWFRFYTEALDDPKVQRLPGDLFKVWVNLLCLANESEERGTLPGLDDIAFRLRLDDQKAADAVRGLRRANLIDEDEDGALSIHGWWNRQKKSDQDETATERKRRQRDRDRDAVDMSRVTSRVTVTDVTLLEEETDKEKRQTRVEETPPNPPAVDPPSGGRVRAVPKPPTLIRQQQDLFDRFWAVYPKRKKRAEAEAWFAKHRPDAELVESMIAAVERACASSDWRKEGGRFIPGPVSWLNGKRWQDEEEIDLPRQAEGARLVLVGKDQTRMDVAERAIARAERRNNGYSVVDDAPNADSSYVPSRVIGLGDGRLSR